jgi:hypothetical protein
MTEEDELSLNNINILGTVDLNNKYILYTKSEPNIYLILNCSFVCRTVFMLVYNV